MWKKICGHVHAAYGQTVRPCQQSCRLLSFNRHQLGAKLETPYIDTTRRRVLSVRAFLLLTVPVGTFALGTWQYQRRIWKLDLIEQLKSRTSSEPQELPENPAELDHLEYYPIRVRGRFNHTRELYLGPRSLILHGDAATTSSVFSRKGSGVSGYCVVTPFQLEDRDLMILVNRGWVPAKYKHPHSRQQGQVEGVVEIVGLVRHSEKRAPFMPENRPDTWFYRDVPRMAEEAGASDIFLEATADSVVENGPVGGQTRISLRNEHLSYLLTWYGLSAATGFLWFRRFVQGL